MRKALCAPGAVSADSFVRLPGASLPGNRQRRAHWLSLPLEGSPIDGQANAARHPPDGALDWVKIIPHGPPQSNPLDASRLAIPYLKRTLRDYRPGGNLVAALERLVRLCRDHDIEPILVGVPVTSVFRDCIQPEVNTQYREFVGAFCRQQGCRFVDYHTALADSQFLDYHHANENGTEVFSRRLATELLGPLLVGHAPTVQDLLQPQALPYLPKDTDLPNPLFPQ